MGPVSVEIPSTFHSAVQTTSKRRRGEECTLEACFGNMCSVDMLDGYCCESPRCKGAHTAAEKTVKLGVLPPVLIVQVVRARARGEEGMKARWLDVSAFAWKRVRAQFSRATRGEVRTRARVGRKLACVAELATAGSSLRRFGLCSCAPVSRSCKRTSSSRGCVAGAVGWGGRERAVEGRRKLRCKSGLVSGGFRTLDPIGGWRRRPLRTRGLCHPSSVRHVCLCLHECLSSWLLAQEGLSLDAFVESAEPGPTYRCCAVVEHHGRGIQEGHYTAFARNDESDQWYLFNDARVAPAPDADVAAAQAYILFFSRDDLAAGREARAVLSRTWRPRPE